MKWVKQYWAIPSKELWVLYDLHRYEPECRQWLQIWADHLDELVKDNVVYISNDAGM